MNYHTKPILLKYFTISNRIEWIDDLEEAHTQTEIFYQTLEMWDEQAMYFFHNRINYLNDYCRPGRIRKYDVFVGGRKCMAPEHIELALTSLFLMTPDSEDKFWLIKDWHIRFEKIHPFWDGNWRVWRFLMLRHIWNAIIEIPEIFRDDKNFEENRQEYYRWFI